MPQCSKNRSGFGTHREYKHVSTTDSRWLFSNAAATRSLSLSCLLMPSSWSWVPGVTDMATLKRLGNDRSSFTRMERPIRVLMEQWGMVGVNITEMRLAPCTLR
eukprot:NODE_8455_length_335_cov_4.822115_g8289_i0.p1 GENE.NODE_8455_length_335_cov_4.822115_g8289_i0~~NODE_8455_length_335_cov_4.822115_g8289_i0.p1  ORF type:complete len:111 (-),score=17.31 NODE_8455_length_335_cov_4.822115_g8289_i0:2-313(-)